MLEIALFALIELTNFTFLIKIHRVQMDNLVPRERLVREDRRERLVLQDLRDHLGPLDLW